MQSDEDLDKVNLGKIISCLGSDETCGTLPSGSQQFQFIPQEDTFPFFNYLDAASMKLLSKETLLHKKQNAIENALEKLSKCRTLREYYFEMLKNCLLR